MSAITGTLGLRRKHAFYLRILTRLVSGTLRPIRGDRAVNPLENWNSALSAASLAELAEEVIETSTGAIALDSADTQSNESDLKMFSERESVKGRVDSKGGRATNGALECLKRVLDIVGISLRKGGYNNSNHQRRRRGVDRSMPMSEASDDEDEFLDDFDHDSDLDLDDAGVAEYERRKVKVPRVRFGWPALQVDALKECIHVSQVVDGKYWFKLRLFSKKMAF